MSSINKATFRKHIQKGRFQELFNELGWNYSTLRVRERHEECSYLLQAVGEKAGFMVFLFVAADNVPLPDYNTRKRIQTSLAKKFHEHLLIFTDQQNTIQIWQLSIREPERPDQIRETKWYSHQEPELLYQRLGGIFFALDEEDKLTIVDVSTRVRENFAANAERVTKRFYDSFKKEHTAFLQFIEGITDVLSREWYASLMLNRLMFCYFIQRKGFLDKDRHYLGNKLKELQAKKGRNKFYSFYRNFLLSLFHDGLGSPEHSDELKTELGHIPFLDGGLFDVHKLEQDNENIQIPDEAFERLFAFFDEWEWHLDVRPDAAGNEINPDVIGYIFEKYINDRSQMGAYYTKEDITGYISKNCIIPFLFEETRRRCPGSFKKSGLVWQKLQKDPDRYIYGVLKKGVELELPPEIAAGLDPSQADLLEKRNGWNRPAPPDYALPTEIWREVVERRNRYAEVKAKLKQGEIHSINDFITYNLNILQFAQDTVEDVDDPVFIRYFYRSLLKITILDPTCGSGAFLFAALNILEPLYNACLQRMENYVLEGGRGRYKYFEEVCGQLRAPLHPNQKYFIYKNIILNNLYGVDIMNEAVEITKLRLFLKLMSCVEPDYHKANLGLEPLPDIDFNIRCGNTLVGFATRQELEDAFDTTIDGSLAKPALEEMMQLVADAFNRFKENQLHYGEKAGSFINAKRQLAHKLEELNDSLNKHLAGQYLENKDNEKKYQAWLTSYKPFHWFAEFYEILNDNGGFDVIIGNPPYVVFNKEKCGYDIRNMETKSCKDLYSFVMEKGVSLLNVKGFISMIIPISFVSTDRFKALRKFILRNFKLNYVSTFAMRPSKLFEGADKHLCIWLGIRQPNNSRNELYSTKYYRWLFNERPFLFDLLSFTSIINNISRNLVFPKAGSAIEQSVLNKVSKIKKTIGLQIANNGKEFVYHTRKLRYFVQFIDTPPKIIDGTGKKRVTSELKTLRFSNKYYKNIALSAFTSNLFFWYFIIFSDCRNVNKREVINFPLNIDDIGKNIGSNLTELCSHLMSDLQGNSEIRRINYKKHGCLNVQFFSPRLSKHIIDKIDLNLGKYYGFDLAELDFIINHDIKYRMGVEINI